MFPARIGGVDDENNIPEGCATLENVSVWLGSNEIGFQFINMCKTAPLWASERVPLIHRCKALILFYSVVSD